MTDQHQLSAREIEILRLVAKGLTNGEIAHLLTISPNTVKVHLSNIFEKTGAASRTEATMYGIEHGIIDVPGGAEAVEVIPPTRAELLRKHAWWIIPTVALVMVLIVITLINLLRPPEPEAQPLAALTERWQELAPMPVARAGMATAAYDGEIYAIAGEGPEGISGSVFRYTPETDHWTQLSEKPLPVADVHGVLIGEKIYVPGGRRSDGAPTDILEIYDPRRDTWSTGARLPQPVSAYALADFEGQMYLFGGWDGEETLKDVFVYDPGADEWRVATPMALSRRDHGAVAMMDKIVVLGGRNAEGVLADAVSYYPSRDVGAENPWEDFEDLPEPRYGFGVEGVSDSIYVMGGETVENSACMLSGLVFNGKAWDTFASEIEEHCQPWHLVPIGSLLYFINHQGQDHPGQLWSYRAFYYEIYIPIVK
jgi:DNA-binding CsgD family transcriptional regulator/N-acetylneuraminic acid mutarotase